jgi:ubiquinone/menaquinone biosynthesis C-methylase UbiE
MTKYVEDIYAKIAQAYTDEFFDDKADLPFVDILAGALPRGAKVLDIGCGPGQFSNYLTEKGFAVEGVDVSDEMLAIARAKVPDVSFKKMDMRKLTFADHTFDGILAAYSVIHIPTPELPSVLSEMKRILKPGGCALFIVQEGEADQIVDEPLAKGEKVFMNFFSKERLNHLLTSTGFEIIEQGVGEQTSEEVLSSKIIFTLVKNPVASGKAA